LHGGSVTLATVEKSPVHFTVRKAEVAPWQVFGVQNATGPIGQTKTLELFTDFGLRSHKIFIGFNRVPGRRGAPVLILELNYRLLEQDQHSWLVLEVSSQAGVEAVFPVEAEALETGALLATTSEDHVDEMFACFGSHQDLYITIHGPDGPITGFALSADPSFRDQASKLANLKPTGP
jgi:hypothetical protein